MWIMLFGAFTTTSFGQNITPADSAVGVEHFPTLTWTSTTAPYTLTVYSDSGLSTVVYTKSGITDTSQQISGLSDSTDYWWRVIDAVPDTTTKTKFTTTTDKTLQLNYPIGGQTVDALIQKLFWVVSNSVSGLTFEYQIDSTNSFTDTTPTPIIGTTATNVTTSILAPGTTYYWRVRSKTSSGFYSQWADVDSFATKSGLDPAPKPTLSYPIGNPIIYDATPDLYWYLSSVPPSGSTITYTVEVTDTSGAYTSPVFAISGVTGLSTTVTTPLFAGTKYYWRVRTVNTTSSDSTVSDEDSLTISGNISSAAPVPILSWPIGGVTVYSRTPTLYWYLGTTVTGATYLYEVATDTSFGTIVDSSSSVTSLFTTVGTALTADSTYYWRVKTTNGSLTSIYSSIDSFTVTSTVTPAPLPILTWPVGAATVYNTKPTLYWYLSNPAPSGNTINFDIEIVLSSGSFTGTPTYSAVGSVDTTSFTVTTALVPGSSYKWKVKTNNTTAATSSGWSSESTFSVSSTAIGAIIAPTTSYPTGNITISSLNPVLYWYVSGGAPTDAIFDLELKPTSLDFDGTGLVTGITTLSDTSITLLPGTQYHWRVRFSSVLLGGTSDWSDPVLTGGAKFTTAATLAPPPPWVGDPINGVSVANSTPEFSWFLPTAPKVALKYRLKIYDDVFMTNKVFEKDDINSFSTVVSTLPGGKTYYWSVESKDANGLFSAISNKGVFSTSTVTAIDNEELIPKKYSVEQNYPNPFNPTTTIKFSLPEASFVTLKIYNILGQEVKTLVNEQKNAGTFNVQWRGDNDFGNKVSSGAYIYRVIAGSHIFTKKMILLK